MIQYLVRAKKSPVDKSVKWYGSPVLAPRVENEELTEWLVQNCKLPRVHVVSALSAVQKSIQNFVLNGHSVEIPGLGSFHSTLSSEGAEAAEEFSSNKIKRLRLRFTPAASFKQRVIYGTSFEQVGIVEAPEEGL